MTLHIVYVIYSNNAARCISLFQGSQGEILGFAKPITFYVPFFQANHCVMYLISEKKAVHEVLSSLLRAIFIVSAFRYILIDY